MKAKLLSTVVLISTLIIISALPIPGLGEGRTVITNEGKDEMIELRFEQFLYILKETLSEYDNPLTDNDCTKIIDTLRQDGYNLNALLSETQVQLAKYDFAVMTCKTLFGQREMWSINSKHAFDETMVELGELGYCINLLPGITEIDQDNAVQLAIDAVREKSEVTEARISLSYTLEENSTTNGQWVITVDCSAGLFVVEITSGRIVALRKIPDIASVELYYEKLTDERGPFFKWSLEEKTLFASEIAILLETQNGSEGLFPSKEELTAIASYGFCLPTEYSITQTDAYNIAILACADKYDVENDVLLAGEVYYSFFRERSGKSIWRVIFWNIPTTNYRSGVVEIQAETGEVTKNVKNGDRPEEYIPYIDRI